MEVTGIDKKHDDFYVGLRKKINNWLKKYPEYKWANFLLLAPDMFHLLVKLSLDKEVPVQEKAKLAVAIAYFISPVDIIPELITGPVGYIDDVALAAYVLNSIINKTSPEIVKKHWTGEEDILLQIQEILKKADQMIGSGFWKKLRKMV